MNNSQRIDKLLTFTTLYALADVYVSGHHSEGWGLTLSDAILCRKPVIATGYSGNLGFMRPQSSFLLSFKEDHILPEDCSGLFHSGMKWAYPDEQDLEDKLLRLYQGVRTGLACDRLEQASLDIGKFSRPAVRDRLLQRWKRFQVLAVSAESDCEHTEVRLLLGKLLTVQLG